MWGWNDLDRGYESADMNLEVEKPNLAEGLEVGSTMVREIETRRPIKAWLRIVLPFR